MIKLANTTVSRATNLYRFQVEEYPNCDLMRVYENTGRKGVEKRVKTVTDGNGEYYSACVETGEILRKRTPSEVKYIVDTSISRTRKVMREIVMSNKWDWFVTLTFNNEVQDRTDDKAVLKQWAKFRLSIRKHYPNMYYVAVMERHKDGCIHFHLIVGGVNQAQLRLIYSGHNDKHGRKIYNCYAWRYGFSTVTEVEDTEKVASYILKYVGKDCGVTERGKKRYWASKNCNRPRKRYIDISSDKEENLLELFNKIVVRSVAMVVQFWKKTKNYLVVKDVLPSIRRFLFHRVGLCVTDSVWRSK